MTVNDVLRALKDSFRLFDDKSVATWAPAFNAVLGPHEGAALASAHALVLARFEPRGRTIPYPVPSDYRPHLPGNALNEAAKRGVGLDVRGHRDRKTRLLADWHERQGKLVSRGVPEVLRSLYWRAEEIAQYEARKAEPGPVTLTAAEIRLCQHRAISSARRDRFGPVERQTPSAWWQQITDVSHGWGIAADWDDWKEQPPPPPPGQPKPPPTRAENLTGGDAFEIMEPVP